MVNNLVNDGLDHLSCYKFDWELMEIIVEGLSAIDSRQFLGILDTQQDIYEFLKSYGLRQDDPILKAELFGNFQESLQFIRRYFLKENNPDGLDFQIPATFFTITSPSELFMKASISAKVSEEERMWAIVVLKVMHTLVHVDKDLRQNYFPIIQQQIFDRFYKFLSRDQQDNLYLGISKEERIPLCDFHTKAKKSRDSIVIKLLHKVENVAEELFDRVGVRFVTFSKADTLRVVKFLHDAHIIIPHNIIPGRCFNNIIDIKRFKEKHASLVEEAQNGQLPREVFEQRFIENGNNCPLDERVNPRNLISSKKYRAIQFTCRQLIHYKDPFMLDFDRVRDLARRLVENDPSSELATRILEMDTSSVIKDIRFFYPYEVQIVDIDNHKLNTEGEASHQDYKRNQLKTVIKRLFAPLIEYKGLTLQ